jgi:hypothetical protein
VASRLRGEGKALLDSRKKSWRRNTGERLRRSLLPSIRVDMRALGFSLGWIREFVFL